MKFSKSNTSKKGLLRSNHLTTVNHLIAQNPDEKMTKK